MVKRIAVAFALTVGMVSAAAAHGHRHAAAQYRARHHHQWARARHGRHYASAGSIGGRPAGCGGIPWCGCYMRHLLGVSSEAFNLARHWLAYGHPTTAHAGALVVWPHHVGMIKAVEGDRALVLSGNDGHAVRERWRSLRGAIGFREG